MLAAPLHELRVKPAVIIEQVQETFVESMIVTAYTLGADSTGKAVGDSGYGVTASGALGTPGYTIAASPDIPFGTKIFVPGWGTGVVQDRGGAITQGHLDVLMATEAEAIAWGIRVLDVTIYGPMETISVMPAPITREVFNEQAVLP